MKTLIKILCLSLFWISCFDVEQDLDIEGCTYSTACNYNENANFDDGSCIYAEVNFDCEGNCVVEIDCLGQCNGNAILDNCNICDNDSSNDCIQDECGVWGGDGTDVDQDGICDDIDDCTAGDEDLDNICDDIDDCIGELDCDGECNGDNQCYGCTDETACNYDPNANIFDNSCIYLEDKIEEGFCSCDNEIYDVCGECGGIGTDIDNDGICDNIDDCVGEYDCANVCNGDAIDEDGDGICDALDDCIIIDPCGNCLNQEPTHVDFCGNCYNIQNTTEISMNYPGQCSNPTQGERIIPPEIGLLINLETILINEVELVGTIPSEIGNLTNLTSMTLAYNQLTGEIPPEIGNLTNLNLLSFGDNQLTGEIPPEIGNLTNLSFLYFFDNQLSGSIPVELWNLANLSILSACCNNLSGEIPEGILNTNLNDLKLYRNNLSGIIPEDVCSEVPNARLEENEFCYPFPNCISQEHIDSQDFSNCPIGGCTDPSACNYDPNAQINTGCFYVTDCYGECGGEIFDSDNDGVCDDVDQCEGHNDNEDLDGDGIPNVCDECPFDIDNDIDNDGICADEDICPENAYNWDFDDDGICDFEDECIGQYDDCGICNGNNGDFEDIDEDGICDIIDELVCDPAVSVELWGNCYNIANTTTLDLSNNNLDGVIPPKIGNLVNLVTLKLNNNYLRDTIPTEISNLTSPYLNIDLRDNNLDGSIPNGICDYDEGLRIMFFGNNRLCPPYPNCLNDAEIGNQNPSNCP